MLLSALLARLLWRHLAQSAAPYQAPRPPSPADADSQADAGSTA